MLFIENLTNAYHDFLKVQRAINSKSIQISQRIGLFCNLKLKQHFEV
jgi:hypothetical protein